MSDNDWTTFIQETRSALHNIRLDVTRIEELIEQNKWPEPHRWYHHITLWWRRRKV